MLYLYAISGFVTYSVTVFIVASIISFLRKDSYLLKANLKIAGICFLFVMIFLMVDVFPRDDKQLLYMMIGLLISIAFSIFVNKSRVDIVSLHELSVLLNEIKNLGRGNHASYKRDYFSTTKIVIGYLIVLWIVGKFEFDGKVLIQLFLAVSGIIHALVFSKLWGVCPYCNYKVHNITRRTGVVTCRACKSRIVIHGTELTRPLGRRRG